MWFYFYLELDIKSFGQYNKNIVKAIKKNKAIIIIGVFLVVFVVFLIVVEDYKYNKCVRINKEELKKCESGEFGNYDCSVFKNDRCSATCIRYPCIDSYNTISSSSSRSIARFNCDSSRFSCCCCNLRIITYGVLDWQ